MVLTTRYRRLLRPAWLWEPRERKIILTLHEHVLEGMCRRAGRRWSREGHVMIEKTERQKMLASELYLASDPELTVGRKRARRLTRLYNQTTEEEIDRRLEILRELLGEVGPRVEIEPPFRCDYGSNIRVGGGFYANCDCVILDCNAVTIGRDVKLGPRVQILAAYHPTDPRVRATGRELAAPVTIGDDVWATGW